MGISVPHLLSHSSPVIQGGPFSPTTPLLPWCKAGLSCGSSRSDIPDTLGAHKPIVIMKGYQSQDFALLSPEPDVPTKSNPLLQPIPGSLRDSEEAHPEAIPFPETFEPKLRFSRDHFEISHLMVEAPDPTQIPRWVLEGMSAVRRVVVRAQTTDQIITPHYCFTKSGFGRGSKAPIRSSSRVKRVSSAAVSSGRSSARFLVSLKSRPRW